MKANDSKSSDGTSRAAANFRSKTSNKLFHSTLTKLAINQPNNIYGQEAAPSVKTEGVAPVNTPVQRMDTSGAGIQFGDDFMTQLSISKGTGIPLPDEARLFMEQRFGADFSQVQIHADSQADEMNRQVSAHAFTHNEHIYFKEGEYNPESTEGKLLLAHELTHVVQQSLGPVEGTPIGGSGLAVSDPSDRFEREAESVAEQVMSASEGSELTSGATSFSVGNADGAVQRDTLDDIAKWTGLIGAPLGVGLTSAGGAAAAAAPWIAGPAAAGLLGAYTGRALEQHTSVGTHAQETLGGLDSMLTGEGERPWSLRTSEAMSEDWDQGNYLSAIGNGAELAGFATVGALGGIGGGLVDAAEWLNPFD